MFTGIIESTGLVTDLRNEDSNLHIKVRCSFTHELKIDQSVSHNGVCLTVIELETDTYTVTAIAETLSRTNLGALKAGDSVNLERCMLAGGRFDGHIVQGHVDQLGLCTEVKDQQGSWLFRFSYEPGDHNFTVSKGSICVNGVSLTVVDSEKNSFSVAIIPYTFEHTNFKDIKPGKLVNLEFDILGKYIARMLADRAV